MRTLAAKHRDRFKGWLDHLLEEHGAKLLVILLALLILLPTGIMWRYLTTTATVADEAKTASQTNRRLARENRHLTERVLALQHETTEGLIEGCAKNGNTVRRILRHRIHREVAQSAKIAPELFPQFPPDRLEALIGRSNERALREAQELHPIDCHAQYAAH